MAVMKLTAFNGGMRGKIAGTVFRFTAQGQVVQTIPCLIDAVAAGSKLTKADAGKSLDSRKAVVEASAYWGEITQADRNSWIANSAVFPFKNRWGDPYTGSGFQVFMSINTKLLNSDEDMIPTIPLPGGIINSPAFTVDMDGSAGTVEVDIPAIPAGYTMSVGASRALSKGRKPQDSMFKVIHIFAPGDVGVFDLTEFWVGNFGPVPVAGNFWFYTKLVKISNGQEGLKYYVQFVY